MKNLVVPVIVGGALVIGGCCVFSIILGGLGSVDSLSENSGPKSSSPGDSDSSANPSGSGPSTIEEGSSVESMSQPSSSAFPSISSTIYVDSELHMDLMMVDNHIAFLGGNLDTISSASQGIDGWRPLDTAVDSMLKQIHRDAKKLRSDIPTSAPNQVKELFSAGIDILETDIAEFKSRGPRFDVINQIGSEFFDHVKSETSRKLGDIPRSQLIDWTKEQLKKLANYPSTVKFGWFSDAQPKNNNRGAIVTGTFKASNAFGLETKHEYRADWEVSDDKKWSLFALTLDGEVVYIDPDFGGDLEQRMQEAMAIGEQWAERRERITKFVDDAEQEIENYQAWQREAREFTSDVGTTTRALFRSAKGQANERVVVLQKEDGTTMEVDLARLSDADRNYVASKIRGKADQDRWEKEARVFTSNTGHELKARLKSARGTGAERKVSLEKEDGSTIEVLLDLLSDEDKEFIENEIKRRK